MKKTLIAIATLGFAASTFAASEAITETADQTMQWTGAVPTYTGSTDNWEIVAQGADLLNGVLTFSADATGVNLVDATDLTFEVVVTKADLAEKVGDAIPHTTTLKNFEVMVDGLQATPTTKSQFSLINKNNGAETEMLLNGTEISSDATTNQTVLDIAAVENIEGLIGGEEIQIKAILTVEATVNTI